MPRPLPLATTAEVFRHLGFTLTEHPDHVAVTSPEPRGLPWGEAVLVTDPGAPDDTARWLAALAATDARRGVIGLPVRPTPGVWEAVPVEPGKRPDGTPVEAELHVDTWTALVASEIRPRHALPPGCAVHLAESDADWTGLAAVYRYDEFPPGWVERQRAAEAAGRFTMAFATCGDEVTAAAGVMLCDVPGRGLVDRFQDVVTRAEHRRRGLAGHVVARAHTWARERGATETVIVADPSKEAIRLYEELGFARAEDAWMVIPYPKG